MGREPGSRCTSAPNGRADTTPAARWGPVGCQCAHRPGRYPCARLHRRDGRAPGPRHPPKRSLLPDNAHDPHSGGRGQRYHRSGEGSPRSCDSPQRHRHSRVRVGYLPIGHGAARGARTVRRRPEGSCRARGRRRPSLGNVRYTGDALIAATARGVGQALVTGDRRLAKKATELLGVTVWGLQEFERRLRELDAGDRSPGLG